MKNITLRSKIKFRCAPKNYLIVLILMMCYATIAQNIAINNNGTQADPSAILDISSNDKGFLPPRMNTTQRNNIITPVTGLIIYNTDLDCLQSFDGTDWNTLCEQPGSIAALDCANYTLTGRLLAIEEANGLSLIINYTGGDGGSHNGLQVASTGTTGYTATLDASKFATGDGTLTFVISGTPQVAGTANLNNASFLISIGSQSCTASIPVTCYSAVKATEVRDVINPVTGRVWMDRNLGASRAAESLSDIAAFGDLYQWGRFSDGHQCRWSNTTTVLSSNSTPNHGNFIISNSPPQDWRNPQNSTLWQGVTGVNNPCPTGYRLPTSAEITSELASWLSNDYNGAFASPLKLTAGGVRDASGSLNNTPMRGVIWSSSPSSSPSGDGSVGLRYDSSSAIVFVSPSFVRAAGVAVRCIKN